MLAPAQAIERCGSLIGERHSANTPRLGGRFDSRAHRPRDRQRRPCEVDIAPAQREQLTAAQARIGGDANKLGVLPVLGFSRALLGL